MNGQPLAKIEGTYTYYYHNDHLGTPQKMTDGSGTVVWTADYKPFGEATITVNTITNNIMLPGQYFDQETGLHYNYSRDYNPPLGKYNEADRIGLRGGINLYAYARNNPNKFIDPRGLTGAAVAISGTVPATTTATTVATGASTGVAITAGAALAGVAIVLWPSEIAEDEPPTRPITLVPSHQDMPAPDLSGSPESCRLMLEICLEGCNSSNGCRSTGSRLWCRTRCWIAYIGCMLGNL